MTSDRFDRVSIKGVSKLLGGAVLFTVVVTLVIGVSALILHAMILLTTPFIDSSGVVSVVALCGFVVYLTVSTYLVGVLTEHPGTEPSGATGSEDHTPNTTGAGQSQVAVPNDDQDTK